MANTAELQLVKSLFSDLLVPVRLLLTLFSDNLGASYLSTIPVFNSRMKHLAIDYHFFHDFVQSFESHIVNVS